MVEVVEEEEEEVDGEEEDEAEGIDKVESREERDLVAGKSKLGGWR